MLLPEWLLGSFVPGTPPLKVFLGCAGTDHAAFSLNSFTISATQHTPPGAGNTAWSAVLQSTLNSRTHALNGNTVLRLAFKEGVLTGRLGLSLEDCIPTPALPTYPRDWLLQARCHTQVPPPVKPLQTTPLPLTHKPQSSKRSGRRVVSSPQRENILLIGLGRDEGPTDHTAIRELRIHTWFCPERRLHEACRGPIGSTKSVPQHKAGPMW